MSTVDVSKIKPGDQVRIAPAPTADPWVVPGTEWMTVHSGGQDDLASLLAGDHRWFLDGWACQVEVLEHRPAEPAEPKPRWKVQTYETGIWSDGIYRLGTVSYYGDWTARLTTSTGRVEQLGTFEHSWQAKAAVEKRLAELVAATADEATA